MISAEIERCAGIDVGKERLAVCVMVGPLAGEPRVAFREFGTIVVELERLRQWLQAEGITHVVMESTGSYWKPVFNVLEDSVQVYLANAQEVKNRKGHKTDKKDSWWLAHLLRHAMIRPSFVPPRGLRELRDLTRRRRKMIGVGTSERNRVDKILQDANVKLSDALSDIFGVSGQLMLEALLEGKTPPTEIAQFAQGRAKPKIPQITAALEGHRLSDHHRQMINYSLEHLRFLEKHILELDEQIVAKIEALGYSAQWKLLQTVPAVKESSAASVLAEVGPDMGQFASDKHLSSWAGVCPGNNRSAGKNKGSKTTRGNRWLRATLTECAWGASAKKECFLKGKFWRLATKKQRKPPATVAVAHTLLVLCFQVLKTGQPYQERGLPVLDEKHKDRLICHHVRRLGKLGIRVRSLTLDPPPAKPNKNPVTKAKPPKPKEKAAKKTTKSSA
jgi:transposase